MKPRSVVAILLLSMCGACSTILGIDALDAGPAADASTMDGTVGDAPGSDATRPEASGADGTVTDGTVTDGTVMDGTPDGAMGDALSPDGPSTDADAAATDAMDAGDAAPPNGDASFDSATLVGGSIASAGAAQFPLGNGNQVHAVRTLNDQRMWVFYIDDDPWTIKASWSGDLLHWTAAPPITLSEPNSGYGNNFSVAYEPAGGVDVLHVIVSQARPGDGGFLGDTVDWRATITGAPGSGKLAASSMTTLISVGQGSVVDGPSAVVTVAGQVIAATGRDNNKAAVGGMDIYASNTPDDAGPSWPGIFNEKGYYPVTGDSFAHQLIALAGGEVLGAWADDGTSRYSRVSWQRSFVGLWNADPTSPGSVFPELDGGPSVTVDYDGWSLCRISDTEIHAVAHLVPSGSVPTPFSHAIFDGATWNPAPPPPDLAGDAYNGMVLVSSSDPTRGLLAVATSGNTSQLNVAKWIPGTPGSWTAWRGFPGSPSGFKWLAGSGCGGERPVVLWVDGPSHGIYGADVSAFLN